MNKQLWISSVAVLSLTTLLMCSLVQAKTAVVYFSKFENTVSPTVDSVTQASYHPSSKIGSSAYVANIIAKTNSSDVYPIRVKSPYPDSFEETIERNHSEQNRGTRPELISAPDLTPYDTIYLGFPVWNMRIPQAVVSFLATEDLKGKRVIPFCTHDGYGCASAFGSLNRFLPQSQVEKDGFQLSSADLDTAPTRVSAWLKRVAPDAQASSLRKISCTVGGRNLTIELNNTPEAMEFYRQLPLKAGMGEFGGREFYGPMPGKINAVSKGQYTFEDGTLTYCPTNDTVAIFYAQSTRPHLSMAVYPMGKVTSDLSVFNELKSYEVFEFTK